MFEHWLAEESSLRGVSLDGAWDLDVEGRLHPTLALRRRFDQLLSLVGEASVGEITAFITHDVQSFAGAPAAQQVVDLWRRYVELQQQPYRTAADMHDRNTWAPALAERRQARQRWLGDEVATAFFAEDDALLQALLAASSTSSSETFSSIDRAALSPAAAEHLRKEEAAWADWERRLAQARREHGALQDHAELSALQRDQAMQQYMAHRFDAGERRRVRALLQMASQE